MSDNPWQRNDSCVPSLYVYACMQMWSCWRTRHLWRASRSRWMELCWSTPFQHTHSSRRSSASWWCGCQSCGPSARRPRTTCATCIWAERCPATTCSLRCCTPSERVCEGCSQYAPLLWFVLLDETVCVGGRGEWDEKIKWRQTGSYWDLYEGFEFRKEQMFCRVWNYKASSAFKVDSKFEMFLFSYPSELHKNYFINRYLPCSLKI